MRKYFFTLVVMLLALAGNINAQSASSAHSDYQGTWKGTDAQGNQYLFVLNPNFTATLSINGTATDITKCRLDLGNIKKLGFGAIDFYSPVASQGQQLTLSAEPFMLQNCGIVSFANGVMKLELDAAPTRPTQFTPVHVITLTK